MHEATAGASGLASYHPMLDMPLCYPRRQTQPLAQGSLRGDMRNNFLGLVDGGPGGGHVPQLALSQVSIFSFFSINCPCAHCPCRYWPLPGLPFRRQTEPTGGARGGMGVGSLPRKNFANDRELHPCNQLDFFGPQLLYRLWRANC